MARARKFRVIVSGDLLPEASRAEVLEALAKLFHSTPAAMQRLLRGRPVALTKAYSKTQADNICRAIHAAGAACRMEEIAAPVEEFADDTVADDTVADDAAADDTVADDAGDFAQDGVDDGVGDFAQDDADGIDDAGTENADRDAPAEVVTATREAALWNFVGVNIDYYRRQFAKFGRIDRPKFALTWNWPAFFAFFLWAAYRKLWHWAGAHLLGGLFLVHTFEPGPIYLAWALVWPVIANYLYYRYALSRLFGAGGVVDDELLYSDDGHIDPESLYAAANHTGGVSRAAVAVGVLFVLLSSMAFNHLITERVLQRAGLTGGDGGGELLPGAGLVQRGDGASVDDRESLSARGIRTLATLNFVAAAIKTTGSEPALNDPELALTVVQRLIERRQIADGWGTQIAARRDASGQAALVSAGPDRAFDTADDLLRYIDLNAM